MPVCAYCFTDIQTFDFQRSILQQGENEGHDSWRTTSYLSCQDCFSSVHLNCLRSVPESSLLNDFLFDMKCATCDRKDVETFTRPQKIPVLMVVILAVHNLQLRDKSGRFFHYSRDISEFLKQHSQQLFPWRKVHKPVAVSNYLTQNPHIFQSGNQPGLYRLIRNEPPFLTRDYKKLSDEFSRSKVSRLGPSDTHEVTRTGRKRKVKSLSSDYVTGGKSRRSKPATTVKQNVEPNKSASECDDQLGLDADIEVDIDDSLGFHLLGDYIEPEAFDSPNESLMNINLSMEMPDSKKEQGDHGEFKSLWDQPELLRVKTEPAKDLIPAALNIKAEPQDVPVSGNQSERSVSPSVSQSDRSSPQFNQSVVSIRSSVTPLDEDSQSSPYMLNEGSNRSSPISQLESVPQSKTALTRQNHQAKAEETSNQSGLRRMTIYDEEILLEKLNDMKSDGYVFPTQLIVFHRKLLVRKVKRQADLPLFEISLLIGDQSSHPLRDRIPHTGLDRFSQVMSPPDRTRRRDFFSVPFVRGLGAQLTPVTSSFTSRILKPYIWRDKQTRPPKLKLLAEIKSHKQRNPEPEAASIDYCYVRPQHIPVINNICHLAFWPAIDLSESLQYPDFSCVAMYRKLVIGFAFMVPDVSFNEAYIPFIYTHPEWRSAGIGSFMLYHLIQTCMGKDVTLHVSMTNPAVTLYQRIGFRVIKIIHNFYCRYMSTDSRDSKHALLMKLDRH